MSRTSLSLHSIFLLFSTLPLLAQSTWLFHIWGLISEVVTYSPPLQGENVLKTREEPPSTGTLLNSQAICSQEVLVID